MLANGPTKACAMPRTLEATDRSGRRARRLQGGSEHQGHGATSAPDWMACRRRGFQVTSPLPALASISTAMQWPWTRSGRPQPAARSPNWPRLVTSPAVGGLGGVGVRSARGCASLAWAPSGRWAGCRWRGCVGMVACASGVGTGRREPKSLLLCGKRQCRGEGGWCLLLRVSGARAPAAGHRRRIVNAPCWPSAHDRTENGALATASGTWRRAAAVPFTKS